MPSAICFSLDQSKILLSCNGLEGHFNRPQKQKGPFLGKGPWPLVCLNDVKGPHQFVNRPPKVKKNTCTDVVATFC